MTGSLSKLSSRDPDDKNDGYIAVTRDWRHCLPANHALIHVNINQSLTKTKTHKNYFHDLILFDDMDHDNESMEGAPGTINSDGKDHYSIKTSSRDKTKKMQPSLSTLPQDEDILDSYIFDDKEISKGITVMDVIVSPALNDNTHHHFPKDKAEQLSYCDVIDSVSVDKDSLSLKESPEDVIEHHADSVEKDIRHMEIKDLILKQVKSENQGKLEVEMKESHLNSNPEVTIYKEENNNAKAPDNEPLVIKRNYRYEESGTGIDSPICNIIVVMDENESVTIKDTSGSMTDTLDQGLALPSGHTNINVLDVEPLAIKKNHRYENCVAGIDSSIGKVTVVNPRLENVIMEENESVMIMMEDVKTMTLNKDLYAKKTEESDRNLTLLFGDMPTKEVLDIEALAIKKKKNRDLGMHKLIISKYQPRTHGTRPVSRSIIPKDNNNVKDTEYVVHVSTASALDKNMSTGKIEKPLSVNALQSLEPLFRYLKMVCESDQPFPGFRCGPGGIAVPRRPFMSSRVARSLKEEQRRVKENDVNTFIMMDSTKAVMTTTSLVSPQEKNDRFMDSMEDVLEKMTSVMMMADVTMNRVTTTQSKSSHDDDDNCNKTKKRSSASVRVTSWMERWLVLVLYYCLLPSYAVVEAYMSAGCAAGNQYFGGAAVTPQCANGFDNQIVGSICYAACSPKTFTYRNNEVLNINYYPGSGTNLGNCYQECPNYWGDPWNAYGRWWEDGNGNCVRGTHYGRCGNNIFNKMDIASYAWGTCYNCAPFYSGNDPYSCYPICSFFWSATFDMDDIGNDRCRKRPITRGSSPKGCDSPQYDGCCIKTNSVVLTNTNIKNAALYWRNFKTEAEILFGPIQSWDVSRVTNLDAVFSNFNDVNFNSAIALNWNVSRVTSMSGTFLGANKFNMDISFWNVANVTNMYQLFKGATAFDKNLNNWNVGNVRNMGEMFYAASSVKSNLSLWNVANVANFGSMFFNAAQFNGNVSTWMTNSATSMEMMFSGASSFQGDLSQWNTGSVTSMSRMFQFASIFNADISRWKTNMVTTMEGMFHSARAFNRSLLDWNTSLVKSTAYMFYNATSFNFNITQWDSSRVTSSSYMFFNTPAFKQRLCWDTSKMVVTDNTTFIGSGGSFENPTCRGFQLLASEVPVNLDPQLSNGFSQPNKYDRYVPLLKVSGQARYIYSITDTSNYIDFTMSSQVLIRFNFTVSIARGRRHSICLLEQVTDLTNFCSNMTKCPYCFDIAGSDIQSSINTSPILGESMAIAIRPLEIAQNVGLSGKKIRHVAFINDYFGNNTNQTTIFSNLNWILYQSLNITSTSYSELVVKFANSSLAANFSTFVANIHKVPDSYSKLLFKSEKVSRNILAYGGGYNIPLLESGVRYSIELKPADDNGIIIPGQESNSFFGYGIVKCTCTDYDTRDQTGMPYQLIVSQQNGFVTMSFIDNSVCEEAYAMTRRFENSRTIFAPNYYFYSTDKCKNNLNPGTSYADDLSLSRLDVGVTYAYCAEAIAINYMASPVNVFTPNRVSSDPACQDVTIAWEASIRGLVTSKASTGSIPISNIKITWMLMNPTNHSQTMNCATRSQCSGIFTTDSSGSFEAKFWVDEPQYRLNISDPVPVLFTFRRSLSTSTNQSDTFLANNEETLIPTSGMIVYLKHLQFDTPLFVVDASTVAFRGTVFVRNTQYASKSGCPVVQAGVCAYETKTLSGGSTDNVKLACQYTDSDGMFNLPLPIGATVHNVTVTYYSHEFLPDASNMFAKRYADGVIIDPSISYDGNNFVDMTIAPVEIAVVGGLCNNIMGTSTIKYTIVGCSWPGNFLRQNSNFSVRYVPAFVIQLSDVTVYDSANKSISGIENYFSDKAQTVDLRSWVDLNAALLKADSDKTGAESGVTKARSTNSTSISQVRFQYDGELRLSFEVLSKDDIGEKCAQNNNSTYSLHVMNYNSILNFNVKVFFQILLNSTQVVPGIKTTCDIVEQGTTVTLENNLGTENIPNFEQSSYFLGLTADQQKMILKCYPSCVNDITYKDETNSSSAGLHDFSLFLGRPEISPPYIRLLNIRVSGYTSGAEYQEFQHRAEFVIQGLYKQSDGLSFALPTHTPVMILRDPPGGKSFARYENVVTTTSIDSREYKNTFTNEMGGEISNQVGFDIWKCVGVGIALCFQSKFASDTKIMGLSNKMGGRVYYWKQDISRSRSMTWSYETSSDPWLAGAMSDIFVGKYLHTDITIISL